MQLKMNLTSRHQIKKAWAFAVDQSRAGLRNHRSSLESELNGCVITTASREARELGIYSGMSFDDAKTLVPEIKILVCNR